jgi:uncharacterized protein (TIGR02246 family)
MKARLLVAMTGLLAISLAVPAAAQRPTTCEGPQDACQQIIQSFEQFVTAFNNQDVADAVVGFTEDAVLVGEGPTLFGKEAIRKNYSDGFKAGFTDNISPIDQVHVAGNIAWAVGAYSVTGPGPNNSTQKYHGNWGAVYVNDGGTWKVRMRTFNRIETPG